MLNVVGQLLGTVVGEIDTVIGAQPPRLSLEIRPLLRIVSVVIDEAVPDVDIGDAGFLGACAIKLVEILRARPPPACPAWGEGQKCA